MTLPLLKRPSALLPIGLAAGALTLPYLALMVFGPDPVGDEGAAAHTWQLLMAAQIPCIIFFLGKWAIREPKQTTIVFALQVTAFLAAAAPVFILGL
jgi:hypothetical protein